MQWMVACVLIITGIVAYFPLVFIRKMNKMLAVLERIEKNTASGAAAGAGR